MASRYRRRRRSHGYDDYGYERAKEHIRQARELSERLGGTDEDVKEYIFSLSGWQLQSVLMAYGKQYGESARGYAEQTMPDWRSGRVKMSGLVAGRLFDLLPPRMPLEDKYGLVEKLWQKHRPSSHKVLRIGPDAPASDAIKEATAYLYGVVSGAEIPEALVRRFELLSSGDVEVQQQLLDHLLHEEKRLIATGLRERIPVMLNHLRDSGQMVEKLDQTVTVGKHRLEIRFDPEARGIRLEDPPPFSGSRFRGTRQQASSVWEAVGCITVGVVLLIVLSSC